MDLCPALKLAGVPGGGSHLDVNLEIILHYPLTCFKPLVASVQKTTRPVSIKMSRGRVYPSPFLHAHFFWFLVEYLVTIIAEP